jgi:hypothetical protein
MKLIIAAFAIALASPAMSAELVVNGGFESPVTPVGGFTQVTGGNSFAGWNVTGNDVLIINNSYNESGLVFNANSGLNSLDITGAGNTGPNTISQTIPTTVGQYVLSFFVGNASPTGGNAGVYGNPSSINLSINGGPAQTFTNSTNGPLGINWQKFSVNFTAQGSTSISFINATPQGDNMAGLDDVSVTAFSSAVPEPSTWAMLLVGFGFAGAALRRKKAALAA